jgi:hypothetical protein
MIQLDSESVEDVELRPGLRYAILKVTNRMMTAHNGVWKWTGAGGRRHRQEDSTERHFGNGQGRVRLKG